MEKLHVQEGKSTGEGHPVVACPVGYRVCTRELLLRMKTYRLKKLKNVIVEAIRFDGDNAEAISKVVGPQFAVQLLGGKTSYLLTTLSGTYPVEKGDWIVKGKTEQGVDSFWTCSHKVFKKICKKVKTEE